MSYGAGVALQAAVYQQLRTNEALADLVGDAIFDAMPVTAPSGIYVSLGPEEVRDASDSTARGSRHDFVISVMAGSDSGAGFGAVKAAAVAVADALEAWVDEGGVDGFNLAYAVTPASTTDFIDFVVPELRKRGLLFVGLDVIGDYLTEVNVTSPTCVRELDAQFGLNIAGQLFDAIERRLAA